MTSTPANTGINGDGAKIHLWSPFGESGVNNNSSIAFGSVIGFSYNGARQVVAVDLNNPTNSRPLPAQLLIGGVPVGDGNPLPITGSFSGQVSTSATYNLSPPSLSNGATTPLQCDSSGRLIVAGAITANLGVLNGAATAANQSTANISLSSIDTKTPPLGQAVAAASVPVVLPTAQITALTPPSTVTANLGTIAGAATEATLSAVNTKLPSGLTVTSNRLSTDARTTCSTCTPSTFSVSSTSGTALAANSNRVSAVIVNTGVNDVTIRRSSSAVVAGTGIVLKAGGGTYEINASNLYTGAITAITAAGSSTLAIEECT